MMNRGDETRYVIFDLGGVLIELGGVGEFGRLVGTEDADEIWRRWLSCPWVRRYERGLCSREEFAHGMVREHGLDLRPEEFLARFAGWPKGFLPGAEALLQEVSGRIDTACLSNTNELHWNEQCDWETLHGVFERRFLSFELGLVKPDAEIYEHLVEALGCAPETILFLDDNQINVDGARAVGLDAHRAVGVDQARALLRGRGLLDERP